jgi:hypothetical protein
MSPYWLKHTSYRVFQKELCKCTPLIFFISRQFTIYSTNGAISKYVVRKHLCGAIIQWWFSYIYCALCCVCFYSSSSLWSFKSEGHCRFNLRLTFNGLIQLHSCFRALLVGYSIALSISLFLLWWMEFHTSKSALICICILKSCFLEKVWIFVLRAMTFVVHLSWVVGVLSWCASARLVFGPDIGQDILFVLEFECYWL